MDKTCRQYSTPHVLLLPRHPTRVTVPTRDPRTLVDSDETRDLTDDPSSGLLKTLTSPTDPSNIPLYTKVPHNVRVSENRTKKKKKRRSKKRRFTKYSILNLLYLVTSVRVILPHTSLLYLFLGIWKTPFLP